MPRHLPLRANSVAFILLAGCAAFSAYFCMYAFRKPVAAAQFDSFGPALGMDYKTAVILCQVIGYALSKWIGVRIISEHSTRRRGLAIAALMTVSFAGLVGFGIVPAPWNLAMILLASLPLGMVWGFVFAWLEGRRSTEILVAMLSASFILSSGVVKSVGAWLLGFGITETWMPTLTAALFIPPLAISLLLLSHLPPPATADIAERGERRAMGPAERAAFLRLAGFPVTLLAMCYIAFSAVRDLRDSFAAEIWAENGRGDDASLFTLSELPIALLILAALGLFSLIRDNVSALRAAMFAILGGCILMAATTTAFAAGRLGVLAWMIVSGCGLFLAYVAISTVVIDRLVALGQGAANAGFAVYLIDASGYSASLLILLARTFAFPGHDWSAVVVSMALVSGVFGALAALVLIGRTFHKAQAPRSSSER